MSPSRSIPHALAQFLAATTPNPRGNRPPARRPHPRLRRSPPARPLRLEQRRLRRWSVRAEAAKPIQSRRNLLPASNLRPRGVALQAHLRRPPAHLRLRPRRSLSLHPILPVHPPARPHPHRLPLAHHPHAPRARGRRRVQRRSRRLAASAMACSWIAATRCWWERWPLRPCSAFRCFA